MVCIKHFEIPLAQLWDSTIGNIIFVKFETNMAIYIYRSYEILSAGAYFDEVTKILHCIQMGQLFNGPYLTFIIRLRWLFILYMSKWNFKIKWVCYEYLNAFVSHYISLQEIIVIYLQLFEYFRECLHMYLGILCFKKFAREWFGETEHGTMRLVSRRRKNSGVPWITSVVQTVLLSALDPKISALEYIDWLRLYPNI